VAAHKQEKMKNVMLAVCLWLSASVVHAAPMGIRNIQQPWLAPDFQLTDQTGERHGLSDYRGKVLVVNFWATWCSPCVKEMPSLQRASEILTSENIRVIGIAMGESHDEINRFLKKQRIDFPLLADNDSSATEQWRIPGLPTTYVINEKGYVVIRVVGPYEWDSPETLQRLRDAYGNNDSQTN
jgi:peroxiredoxin